MLGPLRGIRWGILMGPPKDARPCTWLLAGLGVSCPVIEYGFAFKPELSITRPRLLLYSERGPRRLFPNAADCAKGVAAPLLTLPLIRKPSLGAEELAAVISAGALFPLLPVEPLASAAGFDASADALACVRWKPDAVLAACGGGTPLGSFGP